MLHFKLFLQHTENAVFVNMPCVIRYTEKQAFGSLRHTGPDDTYEKDSHLLFSGVSLSHLTEFLSSQ